MNGQTKKLKRSTTDRKIAGICGGLGNYFEIDATLMRVIFLLAAIFSAILPAVIAYIVMWFVVPEG
jgi:phage shock protein PspC (stress-responsive transcriptional regulator)